MNEHAAVNLQTGRVLRAGSFRELDERTADDNAWVILPANATVRYGTEIGMGPVIPRHGWQLVITYEDEERDS